MDREKLIDLLENDAIATNTGYVEVPLFLFSEIIARLKEQEKQKPVKIPAVPPMPKEAWRWGCPVCGVQIEYMANYCQKCGQRIDWEFLRTTS